MERILIWTAFGTGFTFLMTVLGAAVVFFFRGEIHDTAQRIFLGFAAGVMIAASIWSLLIPAVERAQENGTIGWIPAAGGAMIGIAFLMGLDQAAPHFLLNGKRPEGKHAYRKRTALMVLAITLHNIPEGMAVGLSFACAAQGHVELAAAAALALGIGIQNFPEGSAISLPLRQEGTSAGKAFLCGAISGVVEPIFGILAVLLVGPLQTIMPWLLSFAAGAMLYVVVEELIPEAHLGERSKIGTLGVMAGFLIMMVLDVALG